MPFFPGYVVTGCLWWRWPSMSSCLVYNSPKNSWRTILEGQQKKVSGWELSNPGFTLLVINCEAIPAGTHDTLISSTPGYTTHNFQMVLWTALDLHQSSLTCPWQFLLSLPSGLVSLSWLQSLKSSKEVKQGPSRFRNLILAWWPCRHLVFFVLDGKTFLHFACTVNLTIVVKTWLQMCLSTL